MYVCMYIMYVHVNCDVADSTLVLSAPRDLFEAG